MSNESQNLDKYIFCEDLFKIYKSEQLEVVALRGLDLQVNYGEIMAIVGASGSGKSTLLNILAGLDQPSAGQITVGEFNLLTITPEELVDYRRNEVGFVWQQTSRNLIPYLSAEQNITVPLILDGASRSQAIDRANLLLDAVHLSNRRKQKPNELSGGEQQRVAIAVALANSPTLLLADEPTGELDSATANEVFQVFHDLNERLGVTIVIVTHDGDIISKVNRVVAMRDGKTSSEQIRSIQYSKGKGEILEEFAIVDHSGRLQIPRKYLDEMGIKKRARLNFSSDGHVEIRSTQDSQDKGHNGINRTKF
jgi:putative ABC transport system ATP-binding protein